LGGLLVDTGLFSVWRASGLLGSNYGKRSKRGIPRKFGGWLPSREGRPCRTAGGKGIGDYWDLPIWGGGERGSANADALEGKKKYSVIVGIEQLAGGGFCGLLSYRTLNATQTATYDA